MWFVRFGTTSCLPASCGIQNEWITSKSFWALVAPPIRPPTDSSSRYTTRSVGITMTSATVIGPSSYDVFMSASVYWKPHHH